MILFTLPSVLVVILCRRVYMGGCEHFAILWIRYFKFKLVENPLQSHLGPRRLGNSKRTYILISNYANESVVSGNVPGVRNARGWLNHNHYHYPQPNSRAHQQRRRWG
jgi:hypothetical protein